MVEQSGFKPPYLIPSLANALRDAGWNGLFHVSVAAERDEAIGPVSDELMRRLGLTLTPALAQAARLICQDYQAAGPRRRKDLDVAESAIAWMVAARAKSETLRQTFGLD
jgi:hypothetical protein